MKKIVFLLLALTLVMGSVVSVYADSVLVSDTPSIDELKAIAKSQLPSSNFYKAFDKCNTFIVYRYQSTLFPDYYTYELVCCSSSSYPPRYSSSESADNTFFKEYEAGVKSPALLVGGAQNSYDSNFFEYYIFEFSQNWNYIICSGGGSSYNNPHVVNLGDKGEIVASSCDILDSNGNVFFSQQELPEGLSTMGMTTATITHLTTKQILGLIPSVIGLVILAIGLWKGLTMLYRHLVKV